MGVKVAMLWGRLWTPGTPEHKKKQISTHVSFKPSRLSSGEILCVYKSCIWQRKRCASGSSSEGNVLAWEAMFRNSGTPLEIIPPIRWKTKISGRRPHYGTGANARDSKSQNILKERGAGWMERKAKSQFLACSTVKQIPSIIVFFSAGARFTATGST